MKPWAKEATSKTFVDAFTFANLTGVTLAGVRRMCEDGTLPSFKDGKRVMLPWPEANNRLKTIAGVRPEDSIDPTTTRPPCNP